jgi:hypothetical protein
MHGGKVDALLGEPTPAPPQPKLQNKNNFEPFKKKRVRLPDGHFMACVLVEFWFGMLFRGHRASDVMLINLHLHWICDLLTFNNFTPLEPLCLVEVPLENYPRF